MAGSSRSLQRLHQEHFDSKVGVEPILTNAAWQKCPTLEAWRGPLTEHLLRADAVCRELSEVQIRGSIGSHDVPHDHVKACAQTVSEILGLSIGTVWHADQSRMVLLGNWMTLIEGSLGEIGQDVALMAQLCVDEPRALGTTTTSQSRPHNTTVTQPTQPPVDGGPPGNRSAPDQRTGNPPRCRWEEGGKGTEVGCWPRKFRFSRAQYVSYKIG
jgi:hypothetical protein